MNSDELQQLLGYGNTLAPPQQSPLFQPPPAPAPTPFTDTDVAAAFIPGYEEPEIEMEPDFVGNGPVTSPQQVSEEPILPTPGPVLSPEPAVAPMAEPTGTPLSPSLPPGSSVASSASYKGYSPAASAAIQASPEMARFNARNTEIDAQALGDAAAFATMYDATANQSMAAQDAETAATINFQNELAGQQSNLLEERKRLARQQEALEARLDGEEMAARAEYIASLQMKVEPNQLWKNLSGGEQVGMMTAAFVHDFLGAKGIKTSAMDTWNRAIDRNIAAQAQNINNAQTGFKNLWDMSVANSKTKQEAFVRMRGYYLESMELAIDQHMMQFKTPLTQAQGMKAKAAIAEAKIKQKTELWEKLNEHTRAMKQQNLGLLGAELQNAQIMASIRAKEAAARAAAAKKEGAEDENWVYDSTNADQGYAEAVGEFRGGVSDTQKKDYLAKQEAATALFRDVKKLRGMYREFGNAGITDFGRLSDTEKVMLQALHTQILTNFAKAQSGLSYTDKQLETYALAFPFPKVGTMADLEPVYAQFESGARRSLKDASVGVVRDFAPGDARKGRRKFVGAIDAPGQVDAFATEASKGKVAKTPTDIAVELLTSPNSDLPGDGKIKTTADRRGKEKKTVDVTDLGVYPRQEWEDYLKTNPKVRQEDGSFVDVPTYRRGQLKKTPGHESHDPSVNLERSYSSPKWAAGLMILRAEAEKGDKKARALLEQYAGVGTSTVKQQGSGETITVNNSESQFLPDGSANEKESATDVNSPLGQQKRNFALYELAKLAGVSGVP